MPVARRAAKLSEAPFDRRGCVIQLEIISPLGSLGQLQEVELGHDGPSSVDAWFCQDVFVKASDQVRCSPLCCSCLCSRRVPSLFACEFAGLMR